MLFAPTESETLFCARSPAGELGGPGCCAIPAAVCPLSFLALSALRARVASGTTDVTAPAVPARATKSARSAITKAGLGLWSFLICIACTSFRSRRCAAALKNRSRRHWSSALPPVKLSDKGGAVARNEPLELEFRLLGPIEVRSPSGPVSLGGGKPRTLLADLLVHLGQVVSVDRLIDDLWGADPPPSARHALEVHVSQLRKTLGGRDGPLVTRAPGYLLEADAACIDAFQFERLLAEARAAVDPAAAHETLREALALWRGQPLAEFTYEPFAQGEIARLEELRQEAVEHRIETELALGRDAELVGELEALVEASPLRERLRAQLMRALYRSGRQADALAAYRAARHTLVTELGVEPGPELRELEAAILRHDETLARPAAAAAEATPMRKLVTLLFADIVESTALASSVDAETLRRVMQRYFAAVSTVVARHGGTTEKFVGDAVLAAFGTPLAHEDDPLRAARAAVEIRQAVAALDEELERELGLRLELRTGIATGEVLTAGSSGNDPFVTGATVALAARLEQAAAPGEIAVDELSRRLTAHAAVFEPLGALALRGLAEPVAAFRLVEVLPAAAPFARRHDAPLVGRERELGLLRDALGQATVAAELRAVSILGPAGIGKSRLASELVARTHADATVLVGHCLPYGDGITFWPLREILVSPEAVLESLDGADDAVAVADRLAVVLGGEGAGTADEIPWAFRRFCESLARRRPLLLVLDDLHWAEPAFLDLVEHLAERSSGNAILVVCLAREELLEDRPGFLAGHPGAERIVLDTLTPKETEALAEQLLHGVRLPEATRARSVAAAEGNPLFLEQMLAFAADGGSGVPPTVQALLAARLDRLGPGERAVLERAAVVGKEFEPSDVTALLEPAAVPTASRHLDALARRGFVQPSPDGFRFRHALIQDAAYRAAPKERRADLHERFADFLDRGRADDELVGYHLEQAYRIRSELGRPDRHTQRLGEDSGRRLGDAGRRALKRNDVGAGVNLVGRATALLPDDARRREHLCELGVALATAGESERADEALHGALEAAVTAGDRRIELRARIELAARRVLTEPEGAADAFLRLAHEALPELERVGDDRGLGRTWMLAGWVHGGVHRRNALWAEAAERALVHYRRSGWPSSACLGQITAALYFGPTPVPEAIARCEVLLDEADDLAGEANVRAFLGGLEAMQGRFDTASALVADARRRLEELGQMSQVARICGPVTGAALLLAGDGDAAERALRESCESLERMGDRNLLATQAADLAEVLYQEGRRRRGRPL